MSKISGLKAFNTALFEEMEADEKVICIGEDIGKQGGCWGNFTGLQDKFGDDRVLEFPIMEECYSFFACGAAMMNYRPVVEYMFADFAGLAHNAIVDIASKYRFFSGGKASAPITFILPQGGGGRSGAHHSQSVEGWFSNIPGLKIVAPTTPSDIRAFLRASIRENDPVMFAYQRATMGMKEEVPDHLDELPSLEHAGKVVREGKDLTVIAYHRPLVHALSVVEEVEKETGKSIEIIDPRVLIPFDKELMYQSIRKTGRLLVAHEAVERGGFGAQIVSWAMEECAKDMKANPVRVASPNLVIPFGGLEDYIYPSKDDLKEGMLKALQD